MLDVGLDGTEVVETSGGDERVAVGGADVALQQVGTVGIVETDGFDIVAAELFADTIKFLQISRLEISLNIAAKAIEKLAKFNRIGYHAGTRGLVFEGY